jgi:hypothetical protein
MKKSKLSRKLSFKKETIANLNSNELSKLKGGLPPGGSGFLTCYTFNHACSYSVCDTFYDCELPTQTNSGNYDPACQCPASTPTTDCSSVC